MALHKHKVGVRRKLKKKVGVRRKRSLPKSKFKRTFIA